MEDDLDVVNNPAEVATPTTAEKPMTGKSHCGDMKAAVRRWTPVADFPSP